MCISRRSRSSAFQSLAASHQRRWGAQGSIWGCGNAWTPKNVSGSSPRRWFRSYRRVWRSASFVLSLTPGRLCRLSMKRTIKQGTTYPGRPLATRSRWSTCHRACRHIPEIDTTPCTMQMENGHQKGYNCLQVACQQRWGIAGWERSTMWSTWAHACGCCQWLSGTLEIQAYTTKTKGRVEEWNRCMPWRQRTRWGGQDKHYWSCGIPSLSWILACLRWKGCCWYLFSVESISHDGPRWQGFQLFQNFSELLFAEWWVHAHRAMFLCLADNPLQRNYSNTILNNIVDRLGRALTGDLPPHMMLQVLNLPHDIHNFLHQLQLVLDLKSEIQLLDKWITTLEQLNPNPMQNDSVDHTVTPSSYMTFTDNVNPVSTVQDPGSTHRLNKEPYEEVYHFTPLSPRPRLSALRQSSSMSILPRNTNGLHPTDLSPCDIGQ